MLRFKGFSYWFNKVIGTIDKAKKINAMNQLQLKIIKKLHSSIILPISLLQFHKNGLQFLQGIFPILLVLYLHLIQFPLMTDLHLPQLFPQLPFPVIGLNLWSFDLSLVLLNLLFFYLSDSLALFNNFDQLLELFIFLLDGLLVCSEGLAHVLELSGYLLNIIILLPQLLILLQQRIWLLTQLLTLLLVLLVFLPQTLQLLRIRFLLCLPLRLLKLLFKLFDGLVLVLEKLGLDVKGWLQVLTSLLQLLWGFLLFEQLLVVPNQGGVGLFQVTELLLCALLLV